MGTDMSEEPGPEALPPLEGAAIPQPVGRTPRRWPSMGRKLLTFWPTLGGLALIVVALLGGSLLPIAKECPSVLGYQAMVPRTDLMVATCKGAAVSMIVVWLAVLVAGAAGIIVGLVRWYRSLPPQAPVRRVGAQPAFVASPQPQSGLHAPGEHVVGWAPGPGCPWMGDGRAVHPVGRRPRKWPYVVAIVVLAVGVLGLGAGYAYSTNSAEQWRATADRTSQDLASMTAERDDLSEKNSSLTTQLSDTTSKLNDTTSQLNDANSRIRSLANEKAQIGDEAALLAVDAAILAELVAASQNVSAQMSTCISNLQTLQTYLVDYRSYDQAALISFIRGINSQCDTARANSDSLTQKIQGIGQ